MSSPILPDELIPEVLSFLDVKSLMKLKCVCKSWNSLISSNPIFIEMHLHKSSRNPHITLFSSEPAQLCNPNPLLRQTVPHPDCQLQDCWLVIGECNGLISLLSPHHDNPCPGFYLHFWNPATHSLSPKLGFFPNKYYQRDVYDPRDFDFYSEISFGFGYHNLTNQYKVVAISPPNQVSVFTLGHNVWKTNIQNFPTTAPPRSYGVYFNDTLNWFADLPFVIISLHLETQTYTHFQFPLDFGVPPRGAPTLCVLMECLCFSHYSNESSFVVWQMREFGVEDSWTKFFQFDHQSLGRHISELVPLHIFEDDHTIILANQTGLLIQYDARDNKLIRKTRITNGIKWFFFNHHVESLVSTGSESTFIASSTSETDGTWWNALKKALLKKTHSIYFLLEIGYVLMIPIILLVCARAFQSALR